MYLEGLEVQEGQWVLGAQGVLGNLQNQWVVSRGHPLLLLHLWAQEDLEDLCAQTASVV